MYALFLAQSDVNPWIRWILSADPLLLALIVLTISGLVVAFIKARATDRCLRAFRGYPVRVETGEAPPITDTLRVGRDVIEVLFDRPRRLPGGERILSQLVYQSEFPSLSAVVRALDDLTPRQLRRRNRAKRRAERPSILRRGCRWLRNVLNSIQDALQDTLGLLTGRLRGKAPGLAGADGGIRRAQKELTGAALSRYERLLERLRGRHVVVQRTLPGGPQETLTGILLEYTPRFLEISDVQYPLRAEVDAKPPPEEGAVPEGTITSLCDLILPRPAAVVRHRA